MISVKDFAASRGKTNQAVYQQMKRKTNKELLEGHVQKIKGIMYLDDEAVKILDAAHEESPAVVVLENKDERIQELEAALADVKEKALLREAELQQLIAKAQAEAKEAYKELNEKSNLIATAEANMKLLEEKIDIAVSQKDGEWEKKYNRETEKLRIHNKESEQKFRSSLDSIYGKNIWQFMAARKEYKRARLRQEQEVMDVTVEE